MSARPLYIFDLDGTLALIDHRRHLVEGRHKDWKACSEDAPNLPVLSIVRALHELGADIWIFSGRSDEVWDETAAWLSQHMAFTFWSLTMRVEGDYTPDEALKRKWLHAMSEEDRARLVAVFDDRDKVVKMWRDEGVPCFQVAKGEF